MFGKFSLIGLLCAPLGFKAAYSLTTVKEIDIVVKNTYTMSFFGGNRYIVVDSKDNMYKVDLSIWHNSFFYPELWNKMKVGEQCKIKCYGVRFMEVYPNIVDVNGQSSGKVFSSDFLKNIFKLVESKVNGFVPQKNLSQVSTNTTSTNNSQIIVPFK